MPSTGKCYFKCYFKLLVFSLLKCHLSTELLTVICFPGPCILPIYVHSHPLVPAPRNKSIVTLVEISGLEISIIRVPVGGRDGESPSRWLRLPHLVEIPPGCENTGYLFWEPSTSTRLLQNSPLLSLSPLTTQYCPKNHWTKRKINSGRAQFITI